MYVCTIAPSWPCGRLLVTRQPNSKHLGQFHEAQERIRKSVVHSPVAGTVYQFDLRPGAITRDLDLLRPIYAQTAAYGHFGRTDVELPWEQLNKVDDLKRAV